MVIYWTHCQEKVQVLHNFEWNNTSTSWLFRNFSPCAYVFQPSLTLSCGKCCHVCIGSIFSNNFFSHIIILITWAGYTIIPIHLFWQPLLNACHSESSLCASEVLTWNTSPVCRILTMIVSTKFWKSFVASFTLPWLLAYQPRCEETQGRVQQTFAEENQTKTWNKEGFVIPNHQCWAVKFTSLQLLAAFFEDDSWLVFFPVPSLRMSQKGNVHWR